MDDSQTRQDVDTSEIATYRRLFAARYQELDELLADLPDAALLWKPFEESPWQGRCNSIGEIAAHAASSTVYLLRRAEYALGRREWNTVDGDEGREEFGPANHELGYLQERVRRTHDYVEQFLNSVTVADLDAVRAHPKHPRQFIARHDVMHALEHFSQHVGHGQITRQLWAIHAAEV